MATCGKIASGIPLDCDKPAVAGVEDRLILFNFDDKGTLTKDALNPIEVTAITLAGVTVAYEFEGQNNSVEPSYSYVRAGFQGGYTHAITFRVFDTSPGVKDTLSKMAKGRFVAIVFNNDQFIEIYGYDTGLIMPNGGLTRALNDAESNGSFVIQLTNNELTPEPFMPLTYVGVSSPYSFATAKADILALL